MLTIIYRWQQTLSSTALSLVTISILFVSEVVPLLSVLDWTAIAAVVFGEGSESDDGQWYFAPHVSSTVDGALSTTNSLSDPLLAADCHVGITHLAADDGSIDAMAIHLDSMSATATSATRFSDASEPARAQWQIDLSEIQTPPLGRTNTDVFRRSDHTAEESRPSGFSALRCGVYREQTVAIQTYTLPHSGPSDEQRSLMTELAVDLAQHSDIDHPNLLRSIGVALDPTHTSRLHHVTEMMTQSLYRMLHDRDGERPNAPSASSLPPSPLAPLDPALLLRLAREIASGVAALHAHDITHGHLQSSTVLLTSDLHVKLSDIGALRLKSYAEVVLARRLSHPAYAAPEILIGTHTPTHASDVFAIGVLMCELRTRVVPWFGRSHTDIVAGVVRDHAHLRLLAAATSDEPDDATRSAMRAFDDIVRDCWQTEPTERPSAATVAQRIADMEEHHRQTLSSKQLVLQAP